MSSTGNTSARNSWKIRNISAVQRPMPLHVDEPFDQGLVGEAGPLRRVERAGHEVTREVAHVGGLALGEAAAAQRRQARAAEARRVEPRRRAGAAAVATTTRSQIVCAALTEICWPTIARASVVNGIAAALQVNAGMAPDHPFQNGVPPAELARGVIPVGGLHRARRPLRAVRARQRGRASRDR